MRTSYKLPRPKGRGIPSRLVEATAKRAGKLVSARVPTSSEHRFIPAPTLRRGGVFAFVENKKNLIGMFFVGIFLMLGMTPAFAGVLCDPCDVATPCDPGLDCVDGVCQKPGIITFCPSTKTNSLTVFIKSIINFIFYIALAVVPLFLVIGGVMFIKSGGNPEQVKKAKELILWSGIGLAVLLLAQAIKAVIESLTS